MEEQREPTKKNTAWLILIFVTGFGVGALSTWAYLNNTIKHESSNESTFTPAKNSPVSIDPTGSWTKYNNAISKFSLRHPASWKVNGCENGYVTLSPDEQGMGVCNSGVTGQISVISFVGDLRAQYDRSLSYPDKDTSSDVVLDGAVGKRQSAVITKESTTGAGYAVGTKLVRYIIFVRGRTYVCTYEQFSGTQDVLGDFDLMVQKTLTFTS